MGVCKTFFLSFKAPDTVNVHVKLTVGIFLIGSAAVSAEYYLKKKKKRLLMKIPFLHIFLI